MATNCIGMETTISTQTQDYTEFKTIVGLSGSDIWAQTYPHNIEEHDLDEMATQRRPEREEGSGQCKKRRAPDK